MKQESFSRSWILARACCVPPTKITPKIRLSSAGRGISRAVIEIAGDCKYEPCPYSQLKPTDTGYTRKAPCATSFDFCGTPLVDIASPPGVAPTFSGESKLIVA